MNLPHVVLGLGVLLALVATTEAAPSASPVAAPIAPKPAASGNILKNFARDGDRWSYHDGNFEMSGVLLKPEGRGPFPAVLISHGLGGSAESFGLTKAREMVKWGFVCIAPNYTHNAALVRAPKRTPNTDPSGTNPPRGAPPSANYGASEENLRRARTAVEILRSLPEVDGQRIAAYGHSMGGFVTIGLAASAPGLLKAAAISGGGVAPRAGFPAPSVEAADRIRTPFLILHGGNDRVVVPEQSASLKEVLDRNHVPNERRVFEGEGHPVDQSRRDEVFARIKQWFTQHGVLTP